MLHPEILAKVLNLQLHGSGPCRGQLCYWVEIVILLLALAVKVVVNLGVKATTE